MAQNLEEWKKEFKATSPVPEPFKSIIIATADFLDLTLGNFIKLFGLVWSNLFKAWNNWWDQLSSPLWDHILGQYEKLGVLDEDTRHNLELHRGQVFPIDLLFLFGIYVSLLYNYITGASYAVFAAHRHTLANRYRPELPWPGQVTPAALIAPEKTTIIRNALRQYGLKDEHIDLLFLALYKPVPEDTVRRLRLRGVYTKDDAFTRLNELGYTDTRIKEIMQTWEVIPPITDLIRMAYRGSFDPANRQKWPWAFEAPGSFKEWAEKQGVSESWAERYWYMHWTQPGVREMFEMMHRGALSEEDLEHTMRVVGYSDYWIKKVKQITYNPYTRVDTRRMAEMLDWTDEDITRCYLDLGYDEEHAKNLTTFTKRYNLETQRELTRTQVIDMYRAKEMDHDEAKLELQAMGYNETRAELLLAWDDYNEVKERQDLQIDNVKSRFEQNLISKTEARDKLNKLDLNGSYIDILLNKWDITRQAGIRMPSKTDLEKFRKHKIIDEDTHRFMLQSLGYNWQTADWYLQLFDKTKGKG